VNDDVHTCPCFFSILFFSAFLGGGGVSFGFDSSESFVVPSEVADFYAAVTEKGAKKEQEFNALFATYEVIRETNKHEKKGLLGDEMKLATGKLV